MNQRTESLIKTSKLITILALRETQIEPLEGLYQDLDNQTNETISELGDIEILDVKDREIYEQRSEQEKYFLGISRIIIYK